MVARMLGGSHRGATFRRVGPSLTVRWTLRPSPRQPEQTREGACIMRRIALIATVVFVLTGLVGITRGNGGLAAQEAQADFTGHAWVGTWMANTPGGLAPGYFAADGSVVMGLQASQAGPMGVAFVSS